MVKSMEKPFDISAYHDEYQQRIRDAITAKIKGQEIVSVDNSNNIYNADYMEAMRQVVEMLQSGKAGIA